MTGFNWVIFLGTQPTPSIYSDADLLEFSAISPWRWTESDSSSLRSLTPRVRAEHIFEYLMKGIETELA
jgi:hypothetical protein